MLKIVESSGFPKTKKQTNKNGKHWYGGPRHSSSTTTECEKLSRINLQVFLEFVFRISIVQDSITYTV